MIASASREFSGVCVFGEMVNLLWEAGNLPMSIELERYWHELLREHRFSLMCAYAMDPLSAELFRGPLQQVCGVHSHVIPTTNYERLDRSVSRAIDGVLGPTLANMLRSLVLSQRRRFTLTEMPLAQSVLFWLRENMPVMCDKVLLQAKAHFDRDRARKDRH